VARLGPTGIAAAVVLARLARGRRRRPPLAAIAADARPPSPVSVVVPARDEEERLPACLAALAADGTAAEVVVVDDDSSDDTAAVAATAGARVVRGAPLPDGWGGKAWALEQGLAAARGEVVVFLDADARARPGLLAALARELDHADVVSAGPRFACDGALAQALHAAMLTTLVYRFGPTDVDGWQPRPARAVLNGQCIAVRADTLRAAGGWARVRGSLVEDVALAQTLRSDGLRLRFVDAADLLEVRMYDSAAETWHGWGRSLMAGEATGRAWLVADLAVLWLAMALALPRLLLRRRALDAALVALRLALLGALARSYRPRGAGFWLSPLADLPVAARLTASVLRPERTWRGRTYPATRTARR
jgi:dolichol-phosphate mannosyltransferase